MKLLLSLAVLLNYHFCFVEGSEDNIRILVVKQQVVRNRGHHPENNRRVVFRLTNKTNRPVIIYGIKYDGAFDPIGYLIEFSKDKNEWVYPNGETSEPSFGNVSSIEKEKYILKSGGAIQFTAEMSFIQAGRRFKRTVYVAFKDGESPREVRSDEFILN
jgi:hypothetical protein